MDQSPNDDRRDDDATNASDGPERAPLDTAISNLLEEARMLLPGTQTLFGFQLIVVFNSSFDRLSRFEQYLQGAAMLLTAVSIALLMAPAAYHRQAEPEHVSRRFVRHSTRMLTAGTVPFAISVGIEIYLVASLIAGKIWLSAGAAAVILLILGLLWYALPWRARYDDGDGTARPRA